MSSSQQCKVDIKTLTEEGHIMSIRKAEHDGTSPLVIFKYQGEQHKFNMDQCQDHVESPAFQRFFTSTHTPKDDHFKAFNVILYASAGWYKQNIEKAIKFKIQKFSQDNDKPAIYRLTKTLQLQHISGYLLRTLYKDITEAITSKIQLTSPV